MNSHRSVSRIAGLFVVALLAILFRGVSSSSEPVTRIFVVAVHDSSLFTLCPPALRRELASGGLISLPPPGSPWYDSNANMFFFNHYRMRIEPDGWLEVDLGGSVDQHSGYVSLVGLRVPPPFFPKEHGILERPRLDWRELSRMVTGVGPSGWMDPEMQKEIEAEFKKRKEYVLVDSAEKADLIFLVEGLYYTYWLPGGGGSIRLNYSHRDRSVGFGMQFCQAGIAVVVPSEVYRRNPANSEALLAGRVWEGISLGERHDYFPGSVFFGRRDEMEYARSASPKELVKRFLKKEKWPADVPPVCAAWAMVPLSAPGGGAVKGGLKTADGAQPVMPVETAKAPAGDQVIRINTTLVTVPVIARDVEGKHLSGLTIRDFRLYEDGVEQEIDRLVSESASFQTALMIDISQSTGRARADIEAAALAFAKGLRLDDELMVLSFSNRVHVESEFTRDQNELRRAIAQSRARGGTPYLGENPRRLLYDPTRLMGTRLYDAVDLIVTERFNKISGRKAILLFTDGVDTGSRLTSSLSALARIEESDVLVYVIHYDTPPPKVSHRDAMAGTVAAYAQGAEYLQQLATHSGGRLFNASTDPGFREAFSYITEEMGGQYTLCYYPTATLNDTSFRRIQVTVDKPGIKIRARAGYRPVANPSAAK